MCKKILMLIVVVALAANVFADTGFVGPGLDWETAANWNSGVPIAGAMSWIGDFDVTLGSAGVTGGLNMNPTAYGVGGSLTITGSLASDGAITVSTNDGMTSTLNVSGGASIVINPGDLYMAMDDVAVTATVNVTGGSTIETDAIIMGSWSSCPGASATLNIDGEGSIVTCGIRDGEIWANAYMMAEGAGAAAGEINLIALSNNGTLIYHSLQFESIDRVNDYIAWGVITGDEGVVNVDVEMVNEETGEFRMIITPEPATMMLLGFGALALIRRKR